MGETEERPQPFELLTRGTRSVFPRRPEFSQHVQVELPQHRQPALFAVGFHLALKQFVLPDRLMRQLAGFEIREHAHPGIRKRDRGTTFNHSLAWRTLPLAELPQLGRHFADRCDVFPVALESRRTSIGGAA
jgi:hypothetical protein